MIKFHHQNLPQHKHSFMNEKEEENYETKKTFKPSKVVIIIIIKTETNREYNNIVMKKT